MSIVVQEEEACNALNWLVRDYRPDSEKAFYYRVVKVLPDGTGVATDGEWLRIKTDCFEPQDEKCYLVERKKGQYTLHIKPEDKLFKFPDLTTVTKLTTITPIHDQWYDLSHLISDVSAFLTVPFRLWQQLDPAGAYTYGIAEACDMVLLKQKDVTGWILLTGERRPGILEVIESVRKYKNKSDAMERAGADGLSGSKLEGDVPKELLEQQQPRGVPLPAKPSNPYLEGKAEEATIVPSYINPYLADGAAF